MFASFLSVPSPPHPKKGDSVGQETQSNLETRIQKIEEIVLQTDGPHIGEALGITYATIQECLISVGDFAHDLSALSQNLMGAMGELVPEEYATKRAEVTAPPDLTVIHGDSETDDDSIS